jgi:hypothetical protein
MINSLWLVIIIPISYSLGIAIKKRELTTNGFGWVNVELSKRESEDYLKHGGR